MKKLIIFFRKLKNKLIKNILTSRLKTFPTFPVSQPYIVTITSTRGSAANHFEIFGSYEFINNAGFTAAGDLVIGNITISSGISGISYREMLYQFMNNPFSVGITYLQSETANQILESLSINTRNANGNETQKTFVPKIDPYQQQSTIVALKDNYRIDGFTKIIIRSIFAKTTLKLYLYPLATKKRYLFKETTITQFKKIIIFLLGILIGSLVTAIIIHLIF